MEEIILKSLIVFLAIFEFGFIISVGERITAAGVEAQLTEARKRLASLLK